MNPSTPPIVLIHGVLGFGEEAGKYPEWDEDHPIHFAAHSAGAQVVRVLQQMLADKTFKGLANTSGNWVASLTSLCGALNGSTKAYIMGMKPEDWRHVKPVSVLQICCLGIILYDWLDMSWMKSYYHFGFDHFNISRRKIGVRGLVDCLLGNAGPFASGDWVLPDITISGSIHTNSQLTTFPNTFYFSYPAKLTKRVRGFIVPTSIPEMNPWFFFEVFLMSLWRYPTDLPPPYEGDEDWWDNDGVLNTISMTHPILPNEHPHQLVADELNLQPRLGIWYYKIMEAYHSQFLTNAGTEGNQFSQLSDTVFKRCRQLVIKKSSAMVLQNEDD
ncbi:hypothetical protein RJ639_043546 [Escallonia herrerae]|uniref:Lipase n=1 Tax=Escallonia herrerae TaxID=1293975 RepID=A0AA88WDI4_9ASTE|nr:hypothetical protein RJ639_043546 [Escallonia herrerae]